MTRVCVYCGSNASRRPDYAEAAKALARAMVTRQIDLVYGGASVGVMGVLADTVLAEGGGWGLPHQGVSRAVDCVGWRPERWGEPQRS
jgi:predicted Rossmann-fold nucleotide-binding protein